MAVKRKTTSKAAMEYIKARATNPYGDDNTPDVDKNSKEKTSPTEDDRPRRDGPGGE